jgi:hypothetical protein
LEDKMIVSRRALLATAAIAPLAGCAALGIGGTPTPTQLQDDVTTLANGLAGIVTALKSLPVADQPSATVLAQIQTELDALKADAAAIGATATPNQTVLQQISNAVGIIATLATPFFPVAGTVAMVVQGALAFLPTILGVIGITAAQAPRASATVVSVNGRQLDGKSARLILKGAAITGE